MPKIKIKYFDHVAKIEQHGNWIDVKSAITMPLEPFRVEDGKVIPSLNIVPLGFVMRLPKHYEAHLVPRSSTFKHFASTQANCMGIIDETYCGPEDEWKMPLLSFDEIILNRGERVGQFRIELSQNAPWYAKLKWLFSGKIKFIEVNELKSPNRGGFGSTGK